MTIRPPKFKVGPDDPFRNDTLARRGRVESLCRLIMDQQDAAVVSISGGFGTGKSVFLEMCAAHLQRESESVSVVRFDAWQQSHTNNPLVDLVSALAQHLPEDRKHHILEIAVKMGRQITRNVVEQVIAGATAGILNLDWDFGETENPDIGFSAWAEAERRVTDFKEALAELVNSDSGRLVVFIDELDRCFPEYAMELLNTARYLFDVAGVVIVLGINRTELEHRVRDVYGAECDADAYLRRFVDLPIDLGRPEPSQLSTYMGRTLENAEIPQSRQGNALGTALQLVALEPNASLRDLEQTVHRVRQLLSPRHRLSLWDVAIVAMLVLRKVDRDVYDQFATDRCDAFDAAAALRNGLPDASAQAAGRGHGALRSMVSALMVLKDSQDRTPVDLSEEDFEKRREESGLGDPGVLRTDIYGVFDASLQARAVADRIDLVI